MNHLVVTWRDIERALKPVSPTHHLNFLKAPQPDQVCTDSRQLKAEQWFLPLRGANFDGHNFILQALEKGAGGFFYAKGFQSKLSNEQLKRGISVEDTLKALGDYAHLWRSKLTTKICGLTGSTGKTTVKDLLATILDPENCIKTIGSQNNEIGVPLTILRIEEQHKFAVLEMGARHTGDIKLLNEIAAPDLCSVINIGMTHLAEFGSKDNIIKAKLEMFDYSPQNAILIFNADDPNMKSCVKKLPNRCYSFGQSVDAFVRLKNISFDKKNRQTVINLIINKKPVDLVIPGFHASYGINVAAACAMANALNISSEQMKAQLLKFQPSPGRYNIIDLPQAIIVDDSYNASPDSMYAGLMSVKHMYKEQPVVLILGDMLELGKASKELHEGLGKQILELTAPDFICLVGKEINATYRFLADHGVAKTKIYLFSKVEELMTEFTEMFKKQNIFKNNNKVVFFIKASHGIALDKFIPHLTTFLREP